MSYQQIRLNKTKEIQEVLEFLKDRFKIMSEAEILKMLLSQAYISFQKEDKLDFSELSSKDLLNKASESFNLSQDNDEPDNIINN